MLKWCPSVAEDVGARGAIELERDCSVVVRRSVQFNEERLVLTLQVLASAADEKRVRFRNHGKDDSQHNERTKLAKSSVLNRTCSVQLALAIKGRSCIGPLCSRKDCKTSR